MLGSHLALDALHHNFPGTVHHLTSTSDLSGLDLSGKGNYLVIVRLMPVAGAKNEEAAIASNGELELPNLRVTDHSLPVQLTTEEAAGCQQWGLPHPPALQAPADHPLSTESWPCRLWSHLHHVVFVNTDECPCGMGHQTPEHILQHGSSHNIQMQCMAVEGGGGLRKKMWSYERSC